jgi:hypothetical protein
MIKAVLTRKNGADAAADIGSREALNRFRKAAAVFTVRSIQSRETARHVLISEGIYTKSGKLAKNYR